jgi:YYY domain-containing protein
LAAILLLGGALRFVGLNWDEDQHLHPDERFLTMVENSLAWPSSLGEYFDTEANPLNPYNRGFGAYVYGLLPLVVAKFLGQLTGLTGYGGVFLVGRAMSGALDLGSVLLVFLIGRRLYGERAGLLGALLAALSVLNIQNAHFFTVDAMTTFFVTLALFFAVRVAQGEGWVSIVGLGLAFGLAVSCKISVLTFLLVIGLAALVRVFARPPAEARPRPPAGAVRYLQLGPWRVSLRVERDPAERLTATDALLWRLLIAGLIVACVAFIAFWAFRVAQPQAFTGPGLLGLRINPRWLEDMRYIQKLVGGEIDYPPSHQWAARAPVLYMLQNLALWGVGLPLGLAIWAAWGLMAVQIYRRNRWEHLLPWVWMTLTFFYQSVQFVKTVRYLLPIYPTMALMAGYGLCWLWGRAARARWPLKAAARGAVVAVALGTALWALAFAGIYTRPVTRVAASRWIYQNIPPGSSLSFELWDDPLPLNLDGNIGDQVYDTVRMDLYWEDTPEKRQEFYRWLEQVGYIVLSSNRLYGSIPRLPTRYPMTTRYYEALFSGELGFDLLAEFTSRPRLFGIEIADDDADETFTVYDHPKVLIYQKRDDFDLARVRALFDDLELERVVRIMPRQVTAAPNNLMLDVGVWQAQRQSGSWSALFDRSDLANRYPALFWGLALIALGLAGFPLLFPVLRRLPDGGYGLAKTAGFLLLGYLPWMAASARLLLFAPGTVVAALGLLLAAAGAAAWAQRRALLAFVRARWRALVAGELLFWAFFVALLLIRRGNPDLWHPVMGGEKPMDLAYLNAILKSSHFPPYDPWFAGGYLNYYYWGWVPVASLIQLTGIAPTTAYNLALPTLFALLAGGVASVVGRLLLAQGDEVGWFPRRLRYGLLGALLVCAAGNLGQLRLLWGGFSDVGQRLAGGVAATIPGRAWQALRGLWAVAAQGEALAFRPEWWYWNASRVMGHGEINEFPFFSFLYGDLHAHLMAMPLAVLALGLAVALVGREARRATGARGLLRRVDWALLWHILWLGLALGALWCANSWDYPTYTGIALAALALRALTTRPLDRRALAGLALRAIAVVGLSRLLYQPFHAHFGMAYGSIEPWKGERTALGDYLLIHLPFLFVLGSYLLWAARKTIQRSPWYRSLRLGLASQARYMRAQRLRWVLVRRPTLAYTLGWAGLTLAAMLAVLLMLLGAWPTLLALLLLALGAIALLAPGAEPKRRLLALLIGVGLALTLAVEWVVLKGDIGRMNTVFKFYLQTWILWGVASAAALGLLLARRAPARPWRRWWRIALAALLVGMATYPALATPAKLRDRWGVEMAPTLDGMAYMDVARYHDQGQELTLAHDAQAIRWLQEHVLGTPVILEANTPLYRWGGRVSVYTGLPTIIGWDWHQRQQRVALSGLVVDWRLQDLRELYETTSIERAAELLARYQVGLVYVGELERAYYPVEGLDKFEAMVGQQVDVVYRQGLVTIYRVLGAGARLAQPRQESSWADALGDWWARYWLPSSVAAQAPQEPEPLMLDGPVEELPVVDGRGWNKAAGDSTPLAVLSWWLALLLIGLAAWPVAAALLPGQLDRGYLLARGLGLLLVGYLLWMGASLRLFRNDLAAALGVLAFVALAAWGLLGRAWRGPSPLRWGPLLRAEALFSGAFLLWVGLRILNPDLWQPWFGGEKMMEMAMLNAVSKSAYMPPYDPYFAGGMLNYYYYGYLLALLPMRLSGLAPEVGFNLAVPTFFALTVAHAYWLGGRALGCSAARRWAGAAATLLAVGIGNLSGAGQLLQPVLAAGCPGGAQGLGQRLLCLGRGLGPALRGDLSPPVFDYWYRGTRIIPYTINEFPFFTFLFADLHPHLMAMPFGLLALALATPLLDRERPGPARRIGLCVALALCLGALGAANTWDLPIYLLVVAAILAAQGYRAGGLKGAAIGCALALGVGLAALLAYAPFYRHYQPQYVGLAPVAPGERSLAAPFLEIWGLFVYLLLGAQGWGLARLWARRQPMARAAAGVGAAALAGGAALLLAGPYAWPGLALLLLPTAILCGAALGRRSFLPWLLVAAAQCALLGIEFIYLADFLAGSEWRRMNTVFKFSLQAWLLLAIGLGALLPRLLRRRGGWPGAAQGVWSAGAGLLLAASLVYPILAAPARVAERFDSGSPPIGTLDGTAYMDDAVYYWPGADSPIALRHDREAIAWLWEHVQGTPVLAEAPVGFYREGGLRVSSYTGLPTLVGAHQYEQRPWEMAAARQRDAERIYQTQDARELGELLARHQVRYIYVGPLERALYPAAPDKFEALAEAGALERVYRNEQVDIYRVPDPPVGGAPLTADPGGTG